MFECKQLSVLFVLLFVILTGCTEKPSDEVVVEIVKQYVPKHSDQFCGAMVGMKDIRYDKIEVLEYGKYNKKEEYWPVRISLIFSAECGEKTWGGDYKSYGRKRWDKTLEWRLKLHEDDYGKKEWYRVGW